MPALPLMYAGMSASERKARAKEILARGAWKRFGTYLPNQISGGQQQRVAIARALVNRPKPVVADEPTGNLDTKTSQEIMQLFCDLNENEGITIVLVTHEPDIASYAKRLVNFVDGKIQTRWTNASSYKRASMSFAMLFEAWRAMGANRLRTF